MFSPQVLDHFQNPRNAGEVEGANAAAELQNPACGDVLRLTARIVEDRGRLVGALMVRPEDEVFAITSAGGVIRTAAAEVKQSGRQTMGVRLMNLAPGDSVVAVARNAEAASGTEADDEVDDGDLPVADEAPADGPVAEADAGLIAGEPTDG